MKKSILTTLFAAIACGVLAMSAQAADPSGKWSWTRPARGGGGGGGDPQKITLTLKLAGDKLTGDVTMPGRQGGDPVKTEIGDGKFKDGEVSFTVTREFNNNKMVTKYTGKLDGDTIKGKTETERNGQAQSRDWEAKREKSDK
jgi:hypothetical protein